MGKEIRRMIRVIRQAKYFIGSITVGRLDGCRSFQPLAIGAFIFLDMSTSSDKNYYAWKQPVKQKLPARGLTKGVTLDMENMRNVSYDTVGWDAKTGRPT
jgi:hypothetical protein